MERFLIITNLEKDTNLKVTYQIDEYLKNKGKQSIRCERDDMGMMIADRVPKEIDCAIVIGGDGTMIRAARELVELQIPILGVNMGTLGYLTEVELKDIEMALECILKKEYELEDRMMLSGHFEDGSSAHALNDIVVSRSGSIHIVDFHIYVNGKFLNTCQADGLIISTPTGSTAYNLSAGGPIVEPTAELIVMTPICSHALNARSIVLSHQDEITVVIGKSRGKKEEVTEVTFDGADMRYLHSGEKIMIHKAKDVTRMIKLGKSSFLEILARKMGGNEL